MATGKKTSSEDIANVLASKLWNPDNSLRDIREETGVNHQTVSDILEENLNEALTSSDKVKTLFDMNVEIINTATQKVLTAVQLLNPLRISEAKEMQSIVETAFKQNQLLSGKATDRIEVNELDQTRKALIAKRYNG